MASFVSYEECTVLQFSSYSLFYADDNTHQTERTQIFLYTISHKANHI